MEKSFGVSKTMLLLHAVQQFMKCLVLITSFSQAHELLICCTAKPLYWNIQNSSYETVLKLIILEIAHKLQLITENDVMQI